MNPVTGFLAKAKAPLSLPLVPKCTGNSLFRPQVLGQFVLRVSRAVSAIQEERVESAGVVAVRP
jgi:hypothetical protein